MSDRFAYQCTSCAIGQTNDPGQTCWNCGSITWTTTDDPDPHYEDRKEPEQYIEDAHESLRKAAEDDRCPCAAEVLDHAGRIGELLARLDGNQTLGQLENVEADDE
jgi:hypothetical protein